MMVEVEIPEPPPPELLPLLPAELCVLEGVGVLATVTMLVMTWPPASVVTRAEVIVDGVAALLPAELEGLLLLVEPVAAACEVDCGCCAVDDCCAGVEDCWGCALVAAGAALVAVGCCCVVAACVGVVVAAAAGDVFAGAAEPEAVA